MLNFFTRGIRFAFRNMFRNTRFFVTYSLRFFDPDYRQYPNYLDEESLSAAIAKGKSLIRFGDGELYMVNYGSIHYQSYDARLRDYLLAIIRDYRADSPYVLGIPEEYLGKTNKSLRAKNLLHCWLPFKVWYDQHFNKRAAYFDAHLFYRQHSFTTMLEKVLKDKNVILVTAVPNWKMMQEAGLEQKLDVQFIACPESDAFTAFDELLASIRAAIANHDKARFRVVISAGPASKALIYVLSKEGIISYDLGRGIEAVYRVNTIESSI